MSWKSVLRDSLALNRLLMHQEPPDALKYPTNRAYYYIKRLFTHPTVKLSKFLYNHEALGAPVPPLPRTSLPPPLLPLDRTSPVSHIPPI